MGNSRSLERPDTPYEVGIRRLAVPLAVVVVVDRVAGVDRSGDEPVRVVQDVLDGGLPVALGGAGVGDDPPDVRLVHGDGVRPGKTLADVAGGDPADRRPGDGGCVHPAVGTPALGGCGEEMVLPHAPDAPTVRHGGTPFRDRMTRIPGAHPPGRPIRHRRMGRGGPDGSDRSRNPCVGRQYSRPGAHPH